MNNKKNSVAARFIFLLLLFGYRASAQQTSHENVLFIVVDGLNDWVGGLHGYPGVKTPNLDKLAKRGMIFTRAYCSAPLCNPSRASLLTGVRPYTSGVYNNAQPLRKVLPGATTLPQYFMANGYDVIGVIIVAPGITKKNSICQRTVNLMDIYLALITLCHFPKKEGIEATDITPLLKNPALEWDHPSLTTMGRGNHAVRTERWRYIRYSDDSEELYDHNKDPNEWYNLAKDPKYGDTIKKLSEWLPKTNAAPAPFADTTSVRRARE